MRRVLALLKREYHDAPSLAELAATAGLTPSHLLRAFRATYGKTPRQLVEEYRLREAQRLLRRGMSCGKAARVAGFAHESHLATRFKKTFGTTPGAWRRRERQRDKVMSANA